LRLFSPNSHTQNNSGVRRLAPPRHRLLSDRRPTLKVAAHIDEDVVGLAELEQELARLLEIEGPTPKKAPVAKKMRIFEVSQR